MTTAIIVLATIAITSLVIIIGAMWKLPPDEHWGDGISADVEDYEARREDFFRRQWEKALDNRERDES